MTVHHFTFHITDKSDASDIREVETRAFGFSKEADLVASLLEDESARPALSLLARYEGKAVGHILFTRATFKGEMDSPLMHILAPLAVIPEYQGMGVGGRLIRTGIEHLRLMGCQTVFVLQLRLMHSVINHWEITVLLQLIKQAKVGAPVTAQVFVQHG